MILHLKPTADELEDLRTMSKRNLESIWIYQPQDTLPYEVPLNEEDLLSDLQIAAQIKQVLANNGRVLLLTPDSDIPQELTLEQEA